MAKERMLLRNWAISIYLKRRLFGKVDRKIIPWQIRYSKVFDKNFNAKRYISDKHSKWSKLIEIITKYSQKNSKLLEAGCGTSALSIWLNQHGYKTHALDEDNGVLRIALILNDKSKTKVVYKQGSLIKTPYKEDSFDIIFSHGTLEHFDKKDIVKAINEGLRVADKYIFGVPTIFDVSNCLRGDEYLGSYFNWKRIIGKSNGRLVATYASFPFHPKMERINKLFRNKLTWISPMLVFVIKNK